MLDNILTIDFEVIPKGNIYHIGAVFKDKIFERKDIKDIRTALNELSIFSKDADYILGHNIVNHDLSIAKNILPNASFLDLPVIDTLFLSPLAFPENPYHKLVKDYKLVKNSKNNPVADAKLAKAVFDDQVAAFSALKKTEPDLLLFFAFAFEPLSSGNEKFRLKGNFDLFHLLSGSIPDKQKKILERDFFRRSFQDEWEQTKNYFARHDPKQIDRAQKDPRHKMALVFRSYLGQSSNWANSGDPSRKIDYQIWCGPAIGAFNQWIKGSFLENPENRKTVTVAMNLLYGAAVAARVNWIKNQGVVLPAGIGGFSPMTLHEILELLEDSAG